jgi:hypothetical protein
MSPAAALVCAAVVATAAPGEPRLHIEFTAAGPQFEAAAGEYRQIWKEDGARIVEAMEAATGLRFEAGPIRAIVFEGVSSSGFRDIPMRLRASYPLQTKRGTLVHELGHRLQGHLFRKGEEDHPVLFLYLYDVWTRLYGKDFADAQVAVESRRKGLYDYEGAWKDALAATPAVRATRLKEALTDRLFNPRPQ